MLGEVGSTNAEGMRLARDLARPTWVFAARQLAGRARRGRVWSDPVGNFAASLVLRPAEAPGQAALRSFVSSLALHDALSAIVPGAALSVKWPNDVLLSGGKLAGILLEASSTASRMEHLVIGIGVNLAAVPPQVDGAVAPVDLRTQTGAEITPERFLYHLAAAYAAREAVFVAEGFAPIRAAWLDRAARLGQPIVARRMQGETHGIFETIDAEGHLVLSTPQGREAIPAADVFFSGGPRDAAGD